MKTTSILVAFLSVIPTLGVAQGNASDLIQAAAAATNAYLAQDPAASSAITSITTTRVSDGVAVRLTHSMAGTAHVIAYHCVKQGSGFICYGQ